MKGREIKVSVNGKEVKLFRVNNDVNGNPRFVIHYIDLAVFLELEDYTFDSVKNLVNKFGFKVYRAKWFGGGLVTQSYNIENDLTYIYNQINE